MAKRYFWLKLKEDFFEEETIAWLEEQDNGKEYALFYLKLCLKSLKTDGVLIRSVGNLFVPYDVKRLAELTRTDYDTAAVAMSLLKQLGLVEVLDSGEIYLTKLCEMVGSETDKAAYMRQLRQRRAIAENAQVTQEEQVGNIVTQNVTLEYRDIENRELENREEDMYIVQNGSDEPQRESFGKTCEEIISFLNLTAGTNFRASSRTTQGFIRARLNEGFTVEDFKTVIIKKSRQWMNDSEMAKYLRPSTLFGTKFEAYLNELEPVPENQRFMMRLEEISREEVPLF